METDDTIAQPGQPGGAGMRWELKRLVRALSNPAATRGVIFLIAGSVLILAPKISNFLVLGIVLFLIGGLAIIDFAYMATGRHVLGAGGRRWIAGFKGLLGLASVAFLVYVAVAGSAGLTLALLVALVGTYIGIRGAILIATSIARRHEANPTEGIATGAIALGLGVLSFLVPASLLNALILSASTIGVILGLVLLAWSVHWSQGRTELDPARASTGELLWDWIRISDIGRADRAALSDTLYFESPGLFTKQATWWVMLMLSVAIATFAVLADSTAVVIGAMLVAPLMTPIVGLAGALVNGWGRRAIHSALQVGAGASVSILLSFALARWAPVAIAFESNTQITSRVTPTTIDMLIALAAGSAGAFATVNKRVSSGIAGVAIAVALVPPLAVVGISFSGGRTSDALGALLLFLTNFVAIVIAASLVFVLTGFARPYALRERRRQLLLTGAPFVALAIVILAPLMLTSESILANETDVRASAQVAREWLGEDSDYVVQSIEVESNDVSVEISGSGTHPPAEDLAAMLRDELNRRVTVTLRVNPVEVTVASSPPR